MSIKELIKKVLSKTGYSIFGVHGHYMEDGLFTIHSDRFRYERSFRDAYQRGLQAAQGVNPHFEWRVHVALWLATMSLRVPGDFVECGVNAGFISSAVMSHLQWCLRNKKFYLIDTFAGPELHQYSPEEIERGRVASAQRAMVAGAYVTDVDRVRRNYSDWPNAVVVQGVVPDVLSALNIGELAFLHLDMNCAYPERSAFEYFWPRLAPGGTVLLDDYGYFGHESQGDAIDTVRRSLGLEILSLPTGQGIIIK